MAKFKIALVFSDTGGGHRSAADAVDTALREIAGTEFNHHEFEFVIDNIVEKSHPINRAFVDFYNYLLRKNQNMMKYYYSFIHWTRPNDSKLGYKITGPYFESFLRQHEPNILVSVHPMCNQYFAKALERTGLARRVKLVTVVTDPGGNFWRGWACPETDLTTVPNELGKQQLVQWTVPEEKIQVLGMPINPEFLKPPTVSKDEFRNLLGLQADRLTVCINAGWAGGGNMLTIYRELARVKRPIQAIFLCGHNRQLYERAKKEAKNSPIPTAVLPFHDRMSDLMAAVDLMVTKAGGLTTFEAIARKLPMAIDLITKPMPQEAGTVQILIDQGLASGINNARDIVDVVEQLEIVADRDTVTLPSAHSLDRTHAVYEIARAVLKMICSEKQSAEEQLPNFERH